LVKEEVKGQMKACRITQKGSEFLQALQTVGMYLG
jgi:hypothetical protein